MGSATRHQVFAFDWQGPSVALAVITAAAGAWRYFVRREHRPWCGFDVELRFVGKEDTFWLVEVAGIVRNTGHQPARVLNMTLGVKAADPSEELDVDSLVPVERMAPAFPQHWSHSKVESGVTPSYLLIFRIPRDARYVVASGKVEFLYGRQFQKLNDEVRASEDPPREVAERFMAGKDFNLEDIDRIHAGPLLVAVPQRCADKPGSDLSLDRSLRS